jgi:hypothetical protein
VWTPFIGAWIALYRFDMVDVDDGFLSIDVPNFETTLERRQLLTLPHPGTVLRGVELGFLFSFDLITVTRRYAERHRKAPRCPRGSMSFAKTRNRVCQPEAAPRLTSDTLRPMISAALPG